MTGNPNFGDLVLELAFRVVQRKRDALGQLGMRAEVQVKAWNEARGEQEIRIEFLREDELIDVLEDVITRDWEPVASLSEVEQWVEQGIDTIISEQGGA